jgi:thiamine biosynthesis lipoprotein
MGAFVFLGLAFFSFYSFSPSLNTIGGSTMGTTWSLQYWGEAPSSEALRETLQVKLTHLDTAVFSTYAQDSELSRLNRNPSRASVQLSSDLFTVLQLASTIHALSEGAFDPTVGPLVNLWGFGAQPERALPDDNAIVEAKSRLGMNAITLSTPNSVVRSEAIELDLSGIAKGYAVDILAAQLNEYGVKHYLLEIGGEMKMLGTKPDGTAWRIAIEKPEEGVPSPFFVIESSERLALAGSGDYRNYRVIEGRRYSHEIDPHTGRPVTHALASVTVVSESAAEADAWATALMVLGPEKGLRIANSLQLSAYFILHANQGFAAQSSQRFKERFSGLDTL